MSISNPRSIMLRQYPSFSQPPIYTRSPQQQINPTMATTIVREPRVVLAPPIAAQPKIIRIEKPDDDVSIGSDYSDSSTARRHRKLLSGFHPYYDRVRVTFFIIE